jgi:hypothetical protein
MGASPKPRKQGVNRGNAGKGRPKGSLNKTTASVKAALTEAFQRRGGVPALLRWADEETTEFYKLWGRLVPVEVAGEGGGPVSLTIRVVDE